MPVMFLYTLQQANFPALPPSHRSREPWDRDPICVPERLHSENDLNLFSRFRTAHPRDRQTDIPRYGIIGCRLHYARFAVRHSNVNVSNVSNTTGGCVTYQHISRSCCCRSAHLSFPPCHVQRNDRQYDQNQLQHNRISLTGLREYLHYSA